MLVRVIAPAVQVAVGVRVHQVGRGGYLPEGAAVEDVDRLVRKGMVIVEESPTVEAEPVKSAGKAAAK